MLYPLSYEGKGDDRSAGSATPFGAGAADGYDPPIGGRPTAPALVLKGPR